MIILQLETSELQSIVTNAVKKAIDESPRLQNNFHVEPEKFDDVEEAAKFLHLAVPTVYSLASRRIITSYKQGKKLYFRRSELIKFISSGRRANTSELRDKAKSFNPHKK